MKELINFSVYSFSLERFNGDWLAVQDYVNQQQVDGLELLISHQPVPEGIPAGLVVGGHLPILISWLDIWNNDHLGADMDPDLWQYVCKGTNQKEIIHHQVQAITQAAKLQAQYAVFHVSSVSLSEAFTQDFCSSNEDVLAASATLLNAIASGFPGGEPPVRLFLENLWWPGLTFLNNAQVEDFMAQLEFDNWAFVLDTAHLFNTQHHLRSEEEAIDCLLELHNHLSPEVREKIEGLHLNISLSGVYQQDMLAKGLPDGWDEMTFSRQFQLAKLHVGQIDVHHAFSSPRVREIVAAVSPNYLTHELVSIHPEEFDAFLQTQRTALGNYSIKEK